jgi:hypothetical protein
MGQPHRVRTKRKRRKAYLKRKKAAKSAVRPEQAKAKARKQSSAQE